MIYLSVTLLAMRHKHGLSELFSEQLKASLFWSQLAPPAQPILLLPFSQSCLQSTPGRLMDQNRITGHSRVSGARECDGDSVSAASLSPVPHPHQLTAPSPAREGEPDAGDASTNAPSVPYWPLSGEPDLP